MRTYIEGNGEVMARKRVIGIFAVGLLLSCALPAAAQYDGFQLPPGIENTRIPKQLPSVLHPFQPKATEAPLDESIAYSLKEFKMGMSLDDFSKLGPPGGADRALIKGVCSCDAGQSLESTTAEDAK